MLRDALPLDQIRRVLVIKLRHHGDVLITSPVFSALKAAVPSAEIDALVYADTAEMLRLHPAIANVWGIDRQWKKRGPLGQLKAEWGLLRQLRARDYDLVIHLTEHWRGAWLIRLLQPRWAVGYPVNGRGRRWAESFTHLVAQPRHALRHVVEANLDALRRIGIQPSAESRRLLLVPGEAADRRVSGWLSEHTLAPKSFIHLHPASRWFFKCWPLAHMVALVDALHADGHIVVLTAANSREELAMIEGIQAQVKRPALSLAGQLNLKELAALTAAARMFVGVDSAPMHIAAAVGTPTVALFGPSGDKQWGPWGVPSRVLTSQHACRPCGLDGCGGGKVSDCLVQISPASVLAAVRDLLQETTA